MQSRDELRRAVARALLSHADRVAREGTVQVGDAFCPDPQADLFVRQLPEAFLVGVLFTQGIPAERAWSGPWLLAQRLGHFDLGRLAAEHDSVASAVAAPPALHRFVRTLPRWISSAARRVLHEFEGDAAKLWPAGAAVGEVAERLRSFDGIGEKKAAMAVEILVRHLGVPLTRLEQGTVAYDVHVRRVFLRSGLADADTPRAIREAARSVCADEPGSVDLAAWLIGRETCRPREPRCDECPLGSVCPRLVERCPEGVGARRQSSG